MSKRTRIRNYSRSREMGIQCSTFASSRGPTVRSSLFRFKSSSHHDGSISSDYEATQISTSTNELPALMRKLIHQRIHEVLQQQSPEIVKQWENHQRQIQLQLDMTMNASASLSAHGNYRHEAISTTTPSLMDILESIPQHHQPHDTTSNNSSFHEPPDNINDSQSDTTAIFSDNTEYSTPVDTSPFSLMDLLNMDPSEKIPIPSTWSPSPPNQNDRYLDYGNATSTANDTSLLDLLNDSTIDDITSEASMDQPLTDQDLIADGMALLSVMSNQYWCIPTVTNDPHDSDDVHLLQEWIQGILTGNTELSPDDTKMLLLYLGTIPQSTDDTTITQILEWYTHLREQGSINDVWIHSILLAILSRTRSTVDIVRYLTKDDTIVWTELLIIQAMKCIEQYQLPTLGDRLLQRLAYTSIQIPIEAHISLLTLYKHENMQHKAMAIVTNYAQTMGISMETSQILCAVADWPRHHRSSGKIDRYPLFDELFITVTELLQSDSRHNESISVLFWVRLLNNMWGDAHDNEKRAIAGTVKEGFRLLIQDHPDLHHNGRLFQTGIEVAELTRDSALAKCLLFKYIHAKIAFASTPSRVHVDTPISHYDTNPFDDIMFDKNGQNNVTSDTTQRIPAISEAAVSKILHIAFSANDVDCVHEILSTLKGILSSMPLSSRNNLYCLGVKGVASMGRPDDALRLLQEMPTFGLVPCEVTCGAVIYSLAQAKRSEEANALFDDILSGRIVNDLKPGLACFNAYMISLINMEAWDEVLRLPERMKEVGIDLNPSTFQGVLTACYKSGDEQSLLDIAGDALKSEFKINRQCVDLILRTVFKELNLQPNSISTVREKLRQRVEARDTLQNEYLDLIRMLRRAELEDCREVSDVLRQEDINLKQVHAWRAALASLMKLAHKKSM